VTVSLAGTLFFDVSAGAARPKVLLYLLITMAPFAIVAPIIGPALDRTKGGRRLLFALAQLGRGILCLLMAGRVDSLVLYPLAFVFLVLSKGQSVAKNSLVPSVVADKDEFVLANSRMTIISVIGGTIAAPFAATILKTVGAPWVLRTGSLVFFVGTMAALMIPRAKVVGPEETPDQRAELRAPSIVAAGTAMALLRGVVGFVTFFAAFLLKKNHEPAWMFGLLLVFSAGGQFIGTLLAPLVRKRVREEWLLAGALLLPALPLVYAARSYGRTALVCAAAAIAISAAFGRVAFDSLLQRDGADAARGRAFARFETWFQIVWCGGAVLAVIYPGGGRGGIFLVAVVLLFAGLSYVGRVRRLGAPPRRDTPAPGNPAAPSAEPE
jgi:predicted MFS family arabinose efflux permease